LSPKNSSSLDCVSGRFSDKSSDIEYLKPKVRKDHLSLAAMGQKLRECLVLSDYEAKIYFSLLEAGVAKASTLAVKSDIPRTKVHGVLRRLIDMGLAVEVPGKPKKFALTPPRNVLEAHLQTCQNKMENLLSIASSLEQAFKKAMNGEKPQQGTIWIINRQDEILEKMREMLSKAQVSVDLVTSGNALILLYKSFRQLFEELTERSVNVRIMTSLNSNNRLISNELKYICEIEKINFHLPLIFLSIDKEQFLLAHLQPSDSTPYSNLYKSIFSNNIVLHEIIDLLIFRRVHETQSG